MYKMKVLVVDNQDLILHSLTQILVEGNIAKEITTANGFVKGLEKAIEFNPDLIICDFDMNDGNGLDLFNQLRSKNIFSKFLIISMINDGALINSLFNEGINGFINKQCSKIEIQKGIKLIIKGENYCCEISKRTLTIFKTTNKKIKMISKRELEILKLILQEKKNQEISELLNITLSTVETHKKNIIKKLGVKSTIGLVKYAIDNKLLD
jgi:DNA-binding NarL/FixJ family response regulator